MSKLASWIAAGHRAIAVVDAQIAEEPASQARQGGSVISPLASVSDYRALAATHRYWRHSFKQGSLAGRRHRFVREFSDRIHRAYDVASQLKPQATAADLREPLVHLQTALEVLGSIKIYDDETPITSRELPPRLLQDPSKPSAEAIWLHMKLDYTKHCLVLLVRVLMHVLPDYTECWAESKQAFLRKDWYTMFSFETEQVISKTSMPCSRLRDMGGAISLRIPGTGDGSSGSGDY
ncbi:hypothetical protein BKA67DRAFT_370669 [Truncatella angustata]|uniref:Uncharacterized protein n=1 Tax=Truncatella angustata TaxID=152316 RepID=A0A9P8UF01_9PEZI|nr:uncharacterized protein BKA67DRAFT_370669 [Truncatella angustata]KAH6648716.1 hypothetical protein BKA67DRAFT_370669 [Truncatella angustata]